MLNFRVFFHPKTGYSYHLLHWPWYREPPNFSPPRILSKSHLSYLPLPSRRLKIPWGPPKKKRGRKKEADSRNLSVFLVAGKIKNVVKVKEEHEQLYNIKKKKHLKKLYSWRSRSPLVLIATLPGWSCTSTWGLLRRHICHSRHDGLPAPWATIILLRSAGAHEVARMGLVMSV